MSERLLAEEELRATERLIERHVYIEAWFTRLIADHRRLTKAIRNADLYSYCPFCKTLQTPIVHTAECIWRLLQS